MGRNLFFSLALLSASAATQTTGTATLVGTITDSTGGRVASANVTVVNTDTSFTSTTVSRSDGEYYVPYLNPGPYRLTIEASGFKRYVRDGIVLRTNEMPRVDVQLDVGSVAESITITAAPPLLESETSGTGQILEGSTIVKIPVLAKYLPAILFYYPGASGTANNMHVVGQRQRSIGYTMDGVGAKEPGRFSLGTTNRVQVQDWSIGPNHFPITAQNRYLKLDAFQYPTPYQAGTVGRNTFTAPGLSWAQGSLSKEFPIRERVKFIFRWDINNPRRTRSSTPRIRRTSVVSQGRAAGLRTSAAG